MSPNISKLTIVSCDFGLFGPLLTKMADATFLLAFVICNQSQTTDHRPTLGTTRKRHSLLNTDSCLAARTSYFPNGYKSHAIYTYNKICASNIYIQQNVCIKHIHLTKCLPKIYIPLTNCVPQTYTFNKMFA